MTHTHDSEYPKYFIRCETGDDPFHEVSQDTYYWYERNYRWGSWKDNGADGSRFSGMGIAGVVAYGPPLTESDVIRGKS